MSFCSSLCARYYCKYVKPQPHQDCLHLPDPLGTRGNLVKCIGDSAFIKQCEQTAFIAVE